MKNFAKYLRLNFIEDIHGKQCLNHVIGLHIDMTE
jgi:hypothetical protein